MPRADGSDDVPVARPRERVVSGQALSRPVWSPRSTGRPFSCRRCRRTRGSSCRLLLPTPPSRFPHLTNILITLCGTYPQGRIASFYEFQRAQIRCRPAVRRACAPHSFVKAGW